ncbi:MAG: Uma2 family endonuclease [Runella slithyformis]|nr:MAG: Uma2 family endonuclease [Runella slithyformis]TAF97891.1 MAG: Uma2 family endonuclease [Runella sp.]TAG24301.1 MAG: Uma2 family endonuclease [Cytophagales bacterium]TAG38966.1 MAG: Uma2 family endonuclease [Cytophagia bacterium]TAF25481.1 MAG: Uma2 family endonuclease [Runella slithyformis]
MNALPKKYYTPEEYLELERVAAYKSEYYQGEIFPMGDLDGDTPEAMAGAKPRHNAIRENLSGEMYAHFKKKKTCRTFSSDQRIQVADNGLYTYPDLVALCGKPEFNGLDNLTNPVLIVEVLSKSTADYDRSEKFELYRAISTFREYLLVDSRRIYVELFRKNQQQHWELVFEARQLADVIYLETIDLHIGLEDMYANTEDLPETPFNIR